MDNIFIINQQRLIEKWEMFLEQIPKVHNYKEEFKKEIFEYYMNSLSNNKSFLVAGIKNNEIVSFALFKYFEEEQKTFIMDVRTRGDLLRRGYAYKILNLGLKYYFKKSEGLPIYLWVDESNKEAKSLYKNLGFYQTGDFPQRLDFIKDKKNTGIYKCDYGRYLEVNEQFQKM